MFLALISLFWYNVLSFYGKFISDFHFNKQFNTPYADIDVLQTLCDDSVLRSGLTKGACS